MIIKQQNDKLFDRFSRIYKEELGKSLGCFSGFAQNNFFDKHKVRCIRRWIPNIKSCKRILDFGCGTGGVMAELVSEFPFCVIAGFDTSDQMLAVARKRLYAQPYIEWPTEFEYSRTFDIVVVANVLHHVPKSERVAILRQISCVLSENGQIVVFEHNPINPLTRKAVRNCSFDQDAELLRPAALISCAKKAGLVAKDVRYVLYLPWEGWIADALESLMGKIPLGAQYMARFNRVAEESY